MFPVARSERAAAEAAHRRVQKGRARFERCNGVRVAGVPGVVKMAADRAPERGDLSRERSNLPRGRDPDRVGEDDLVSTAEPHRECEHRGRIDRPLEGTAERDADRHGRRAIRRGEDPLDPRRYLVDRRVRVALRERIGGRERHVETVERGRLQPFVTLLVENETGVLDARSWLDRRHHFLRAGHLRHEVVADEARGLNSLQPRAREPVHELGTHGRREHVGLVLQPVTRADVAEDHESKPYAVTRSSVTRTITRCSSGFRS